MPATYAHRRFGAAVLAQLPAPLRAQIEPYRPLYDIGLHGPDLLFYYHALRSNEISRLGNAMHDEPGETFFTRARALLANAQDPAAAQAYLLGFVCHFALDSTCHPYVEHYVRASGVSHCEIETELDDALMREDGLDPRRYFTASHIRPTAQNAAVIRPFFEGVTERQVLESLRGMVQVHRLLHVTGPAKRQLVLAGMRAAGRYGPMHGLVANLRPNPACAVSTVQLERLYAQAVPLGVRLVTEFAAGKPLDAAYRHTFGET